MSITQDQFEQLNEMGISLWQRRSCDKPKDATQAQEKIYLDIDLKDLANQQLFTDILLATGLTVGEISHQGDHLDLGLFNWYFVTEQSKDQLKNEIQWYEQQLFTPSITDISKSTKLKKQLWQLLGKHAQ